MLKLLKSQMMKTSVAAIVLSFSITHIQASSSLDCTRLSNIPFQAPSAADEMRIEALFYDDLTQLIGKLQAEGDEYYQKWADYLRLEAVLASREQGGDEQYQAVLRFKRYLFADKASVEHSIFDRVRESVVAYRNSLFRHLSADLESEHEAQIAQLAELCRAYNKVPSHQLRYEIQNLYNWFYKTGTDGGRVKAVLAQLFKPGLVLRLPESFARQQMDESLLNFNQSKVTSNRFNLPVGFMGSMQSVTTNDSTRSTGRVVMTLVPSADSIRYHLSLSGQTQGVSSSGQKVASAQTQMRARISGQTHIDIRPDEASIGPITTSAEIISMRTTVKPSVGGPFVQGLIKNVGKKRVKRADPSMRVQSREQLRNQVAASLREQIQQQFDGSIKKNLEFSMQNNTSALDDIARSLDREGIALSEPRLSSTRQYVQASFSLQTAGVLGAEGACPLVSREDAMVVCVHESMFSNFFDQAWSGKDVEDAYFEEASKLMYTEAPYELYTHSRKERWWVNFANVTPFRVELISKERVKATLSLQSFWYRPVGQEERILVDVPQAYTAEYQIEEDEYGRPSFRRVDFYVTSDSENPLEDQEAEFLERMAARMRSFLGEDLNMGGINLPEGGKMSETFNKLSFEGVVIENGWLGFYLKNFEELMPAQK